MSLYNQPVRLLLREVIQDLKITPGQIFDKPTVLTWFHEKYPLVKEGTIAAHLIRLSTNARSRLHYSPRSDGSDDAFYQIDGSHYRLYDPLTDPTPISDSSTEVVQPSISETNDLNMERPVGESDVRLRARSERFPCNESQQNRAWSSAI